MTVARKDLVQTYPSHRIEILALDRSLATFLKRPRVEHPVMRFMWPVMVSIGHCGGTVRIRTSVSLVKVLTQAHASDQCTATGGVGIQFPTAFNRRSGSHSICYDNSNSLLDDDEGLVQITQISAANICRVTQIGNEIDHRWVSSSTKFKPQGLIHMDLDLGI